jgi:rare lipoprotein A
LSGIGRLFGRGNGDDGQLRPRTTRFTGLNQMGTASWYGPDFHGGPTASGERYDMYSMTAAHKYLPFGTLVKVTNMNNGNECVVRINNRGPYFKDRIIDLSKSAATRLGMMGSGIAKVHMQVLGEMPKTTEQ